MLEKWRNKIDVELWKTTLLVNALSLVKIPLLAFITPQFLELNERKTMIKVRLDYRSRNHLGVMYFGALAMGAELSIAGAAVQAIQKSGMRIDFLFKDFECQFLKRAEGHVLFVCDEAYGVRDLIDRATRTSERLEQLFHGFAVIEGGDEPVMKYSLRLSVRNRDRRVS